MARIRFQLDEHVPFAIAEALRRRGIDVLTASEAGLLGAHDAQLLADAFAAGRVLVTQDRDFMRLHRAEHHHAGIAFCQQGKRTMAQIIAGLVLIHEILEPAEIAGRVEFL